MGIDITVPGVYMIYCYHDEQNQKYSRTVAYIYNIAVINNRAVISDPGLCIADNFV